jgi:hypothetical protein
MKSETLKWIRNQCTPTQVFAVIGIFQTVVLILSLFAPKTRTAVLDPAFLKLVGVRYLILAGLIVVARLVCARKMPLIAWGLVALYIMGSIASPLLIRPVVSGKKASKLANKVKIIDQEGEVRKGYAPPTTAQKMDPDNLVINKDQETGFDDAAQPQAPIDK